MSKLIYFMPASLDGFIAGESDPMDWSTPDDEVAAFINKQLSPIRIYLNGRKEFEVMKGWETPEAIPELTPTMRDFGRIWQGAEKVVYSKSLNTVSTTNTRLEREFDPGVVRDLKTRSPGDLSVAGPNLAAQAIRAGLVDEFQLLFAPVILGRGKRILPVDIKVKLDLLEERRFISGWIYLRYSIQA